MNTFHLIIASVGQNHFDGAAVSATIPTTEGEITVLANHEPYIGTLKVGTITVRTTLGAPQMFRCGEGVLECTGSKVTILL